MDMYSKLRVIGRGSYGEVWLVRNKKDKKQYVLKQMDLKTASKRERKAAKLEVKLLSSLKHPNIVSYKDSFETDEGYLYIAMGYCEGGDLYTRIKEQKILSFEENQIAEWFVQICMALQYLHDHNILHRDLKTQNIFLTKSRIIKVGDLGIARVLDSSSDMATTLIGTPYYMSPELFSNKPYNYKSDVWALGCCIYELATLKHAFNGKDMNSLMYRILRGKLPAMPKEYSAELVQLIKAMLHQNPDKRPDVSKILRRPYIKKHISLFLESTKNSCRPSSVHIAAQSSSQSDMNNLHESSLCDSPLNNISSDNFQKNKILHSTIQDSFFDEQNKTFLTILENSQKLSEKNPVNMEFDNSYEKEKLVLNNHCNSLERPRLENSLYFQNKIVSSHSEEGIMSRDDKPIPLTSANENYFIEQSTPYWQSNNYFPNKNMKSELSPILKKKHTGLENHFHLLVNPLFNSDLFSGDTKLDLATQVDDVSKALSVEDNEKLGFNDISPVNDVCDDLNKTEDEYNVQHQVQRNNLDSNLDKVPTTFDICEAKRTNQTISEEVKIFDIGDGDNVQSYSHGVLIHLPQRVNNSVNCGNICPSNSCNEARLRRRKKKQDLPGLGEGDIISISGTPSIARNTSVQASKRRLLPPLPSIIPSKSVQKLSGANVLNSDHIISTNNSSASIETSQDGEILQICRPNSCARARRRARLQKQEVILELEPKVLESCYSGEYNPSGLPSLQAQAKPVYQKSLLLNGENNIQKLSPLSMDLDDDLNDNKEKEKQHKRNRKEMDNFISLLNSTLHLQDFGEDFNSPSTTSSCSSEADLKQEYQLIPQFLDGLDSLLISTRLGERINALKRDCVRGIGEDLLKSAYDILRTYEENELELQLFALLGRERYDLFAAKIWQLKFLEDTITM